LNNQRNNNNNRRRGRGNNRGGGGGGGNPVNRIDSRARGNAPQMLEKYRKLAHEASLNDDRVQTEYYLQFADHYFRVIADAKSQKDEQQGRPRAERDADDGDDYFEDDRFDDRSRRPQQQRQDRPQPSDEDSGEPLGEGQRGSEGEAAEEEANPFLAPRQHREKRDRDGRDNREGREGRDNRSRSDRGPRREGNRDGNRAGSDNRGNGDNEAAPAFDPGLLPPSISRSPADDEAQVPVDNGDGEPARKPRRPRTRKKSEGEGGDEALEAIG
jgi:hypothetical protein